MKKFLFFTFVCLNCFFAGSCFSEVVRVGAPICLTGTCAEWGQATKNGLTLALEEINANNLIPGKTIEIIYEDTNEATGGFKAVTAFKKLRSLGNINFFIGPSWTPGGLAIAPIVKNLTDVLMISPSLGVSEFHKSSANLFNTMPDSETSTRAVAKLCRDKKINSMAIFSSEQPWENLQAKVFREEFERLGGKISREQTPNPDITDLRTDALKIVASKPEAVFLANLTRAGLAAKQLRTLGYQGSLYAALLDQTQINIGEEALEGTVTAQYPESNPDFVNKYSKKYGRKPNSSADTAYDALIALAKAISSANSLQVDKVINGLLKVEFVGASGLVKFDAEGGIVREPVYVQVKGSSLVGLP